MHAFTCAIACCSLEKIEGGGDGEREDRGGVRERARGGGGRKEMEGGRDSGEG